MLRSRSYLGSVLRASVLRYLHSVVGCVSGIREGQAVVTYSATRDWWVTLLLWGTTLAIAAAVVYSVHKEEMDSMAQVGIPRADGDHRAVSGSPLRSLLHAVGS